MDRARRGRLAPPRTPTEEGSYQLLERVAHRAGDEETAQVARENRAEEEAMVAKLDAHWDRFTELSLTEAGVTV